VRLDAVDPEGPVGHVFQAGALMSDTATVTNRRSWRPLAIGAGVAGALIAATLALWGHYGTAVFYEMLAAGIAMCF
jgi:hypothetical protein